MKVGVNVLARWTVKKLLPLLSLCLFVLPAFAEDAPLLFLPKTLAPFSLFSAAGSVSLEEVVADPWPSVLSIRSSGDGKNVQVAATGLPPIDLGSSNLGFFFRLRGASHLNELWTYVASDDAFADRVVFMLDGVQKNYDEGGWYRASLPFSAGEHRGNPNKKSLRSLQFWVNDDAQGAVTLEIGPLFLEVAAPTAIGAGATESIAIVKTASPEAIDWMAPYRYKPPEPAAPPPAQTVVAPESVAPELPPVSAAKKDAAPIPAAPPPPAQGAEVPQAVSEIPGKTSPSLGLPAWKADTQIDFSVDWKMAWGWRVSDGDGGTSSVVNTGSEGDPQFYSQIDDLLMYVQTKLSKTAAVFCAAGIQGANFYDFDLYSLDGSLFYLDTLYMSQELPAGFGVKAGYFSPDPTHKWLQVTRSSGVEPAFGEDMTPQSLWLQGSYLSKAKVGVQFALNPDLIGKDVGGDQVITYQQSLGVPNLFGSLWYDSDPADAELAAALNGDALKIAAAGAYYGRYKDLRLSGSLGLKYTDNGAGTFTTYPSWDSFEGYRLSGGLALAYPVSPFGLSSGLALQYRLPSGGADQLWAGMDLGVALGPLEYFAVLTFRDLSSIQWGDSLGIETGFTLDHDGVDYMIGYTMAGFNVLSGMYANSEGVEGGIDGLFVRIKATYW